jgi:intein/homing endonuclease
MIKAILLKIYEIAYGLERLAIKRRIYTECDLYDVRYNYGTKQMKRASEARERRKGK